MIFKIETFLHNVRIISITKKYKAMSKIKQRLEYLREELRQERISYDELIELQSLVEHIDLSDVELLEAAGVPENFN